MRRMIFPRIKPNRRVELDCDCDHVEHKMRFDYWKDDNWVYVTTKWSIDSIWRRFREAFNLIIHGEVMTNAEVALDLEQMQKLNHFVNHTYTEMIIESEKEAKKYDRVRRRDRQL
jgi:hypothetical protein